MPAGAARGRSFPSKVRVRLFSPLRENLKCGIASRFTSPSVMDTLPSKFRNRYSCFAVQKIWQSSLWNGCALIFSYFLFVVPKSFSRNNKLNYFSSNLFKYIFIIYILSLKKCFASIVNYFLNYQNSSSISLTHAISNCSNCHSIARYRNCVEMHAAGARLARHRTWSVSGGAGAAEKFATRFESDQGNDISWFSPFAPVVDRNVI